MCTRCARPNMFKHTLSKKTLARLEHHNRNGSQDGCVVNSLFLSTDELPTSLSPTSVSGFLRFRVGFLMVHRARRFLARSTTRLHHGRGVTGVSNTWLRFGVSLCRRQLGNILLNQRTTQDLSCKLIRSFVQRATRSCRLCFGSNVHHPCNLRRLATKRSATMRGVDTGSSQLLLCRVSSQSACCMVSGDVLFPRSCFLTRSRFLSLVKWLHDTLKITVGHRCIYADMSTRQVHTRQLQLQQQSFNTHQLTPVKCPYRSLKFHYNFECSLIFFFFFWHPSPSP